MKIGITVYCDDQEEVKDILSKIYGAGSAPAKSGKTAKATKEEEQEDMDFGDDDEGEELPMPSQKELQTVLTQVKEEHGMEVIQDMLTNHGAKKLKDLDKDEWPSLFAEANALLEGEDDDDFGLDDDDDDEEVPDGETVKVATQAYAKKNGKEKATAALKKAGLNSVRGIKNAPEEKLAILWGIVG